MKVRAMTTLLGSYGRLNEGQVIDMPNWQASRLLARGYVEYVQEVGYDQHEDAKTSRSQLHRGGRGKSKPRAGRAGSGDPAGER